MERPMDPVVVEPLHHGRPGRWSGGASALTVAGGIGALLGGATAPVAAVAPVSR